MRFRPTTPADLPTLFEIRVAVKENIVTREFLTSIGITVESCTAALATIHRGWVCEVDGRIIGFATGDRSNGEIFVLAVLPAHEGKGIGRRLLTLVQDWLWSEGWQKLWLITGTAPTRAYRLYLKLGWKDCGPNPGGGLRMELTNSASLPAGMHFREMIPADLPVTFRIRTAAKENPFPMEALIAVGITEASVTQLLATTHRGWVCEIDGEVVGFAIGNRSNGEFWVIAVLREHEGKGIGRRLMLLVQNWLWSEGWTKLWLVTGVAPSRAFRLYSMLGWQDCGPFGEGVERRMELIQANRKSLL